MSSTKIETLETKVSITVAPNELTGIYYLPESAEALIILSHGAGAGMTHPFMEGLAKELANRGLGVLRFNLPYMEAGKKMPGSPKHAMEGIKKVAESVHEQFPDLPMFLAGKSYGGRMSSQLMADDSLEFVKGLIFYGFPLHAPGRPAAKRGEHLKEVKVPMLFLQGKKDKLADLDLLTPLTKDLNVATLFSFDHADHSFKRPKKVSSESLIPSLADVTKEWIMKQK